MTTINDELVKVFGVDNDWSTHIHSCILKRARTAVQKGYMDDLFADVTSDLIVGSEKSKFPLAISKAKTNSSNNDELLKNIKNVVTCAVYFRISNFLKCRYERKGVAVPFSQLSDKMEFDTEDTYQKDGLDLLISELKLMIQEDPDKTDRYELAITILLERLSGFSQTVLNKKYDLTDGQIRSLNRDWHTAFERINK